MRQREKRGRPEPGELAPGGGPARRLRARFFQPHLKRIMDELNNKTHRRDRERGAEHDIPNRILGFNVDACFPLRMTIDNLQAASCGGRSWEGGVDDQWHPPVTNDNPEVWKHKQEQQASRSWPRHGIANLAAGTGSREKKTRRRESVGLECPDTKAASIFICS